MATNAPTRVKKLYNAVEDIVPESLRGLAAAHPDQVKVDLAKAQSHGLKPGDVITKVGRYPVASLEDFGAVLEPFHLQAQDFAFAAGRRGAQVERLTISAHDYMTIVRDMGRPDKRMGQLVMEAVERSVG